MKICAARYIKSAKFIGRTWYTYQDNWPPHLPNQEQHNNTILPAQISNKAAKLKASKLKIKREKNLDRKF